MAIFSDPHGVSPVSPHKGRSYVRKLSDSVGLLIADTDEEIRSALRETFARSDIAVVGEATTPQQVRRFARDKSVRVLLLDVVWEKPCARIDEGIELLGDIRAERERLSIIVYSACEGPYCIRRCRKVGANAYLVKGIDDHALVPAVHLVYEGGDVWPDRRRPQPM